MKNTKHMKKFGNTKAHLELSALAQQTYDTTDPLSIFEEEIFPETCITVGDFEITLGTAIAFSAGDNTRQPAIFVHQLTDRFSDGDCIVFGIDLIDDLDESDIIDLLRDESSTTAADIDSFRDADHDPIYRYSMRGAFGDYDNMTEAEVNKTLEDDITEDETDD